MAPWAETHSLAICDNIRVSRRQCCVAWKVSYSQVCNARPCTLPAGITNHEEYSLVLELPDAEREKTLTLKRDKSIAKDQKKLDELKKKLHTEDESEYAFFVRVCV